MVTRRIMLFWFRITLGVTILTVLLLSLSITVQFESVLGSFQDSVDTGGLDHVENSVRIMDLTARDIALKVHNHPATVLLSLAPSTDRVSPDFVRSFLRIQDMALPFIHSVNVIHVPSGELISSSQGWFQTDRSILEDIEYNYPDLPALTPLPLTSVLSPSGSPQMVFVYLVRERYPDETGLARGVVLLVDASWFTSAVSQADDKRTGTRFYLYHPHTGILTPESNEVDLTILSDSLDSSINTGTDSYSMVLDGVGHSVRFRRLDNTDLYIVRLRNKSIIQGEIWSLRLKTTSVALFFLLIVLLGGLVVTRRVYLPYYSTITDIRESFGSRLSLPESDLAMLSILSSNIRDEYSEDGNDRVTAQCIRIFCQEGVSGNLSSAEVLRKRGIRFSPRYPGRLCHLAIDDIDPDFAQLNTLSDAEYASLKFRTRKSVEEVLNNKGIEYHMFYRNQGSAVIVMFGKKTADQPIQEETGRDIGKLVQEYVQRTVSIVFSEPIEGYAELQDSYKKGTALLAYRFLQGRGMVFDSNSSSGPRLNPEECKDEIMPMRNRILESLAEGLFQQSDLDRYFQTLQLWDVSTVQYELNIFSIEMIRVMMNLNPRSNFQDFFRELINQPTLEDFRSVVEDSLRNDREEFYTADSRHSKLVDAVRKIVEARYPEPGLSIHIVSEEISMNAAYFGMVFKRIVGSSFADYLTTVRIQEAARLLTESHMSVQEIMVAVGIPSESTFFRRFREWYHLTPQKFRRESRLRSSRTE